MKSKKQTGKKNHLTLIGRIRSIVIKISAEVARIRLRPRKDPIKMDSQAFTPAMLAWISGSGLRALLKSLSDAQFKKIAAFLTKNYDLRGYKPGGNYKRMMAVIKDEREMRRK